MFDMLEQRLLEIETVAWELPRENRLVSCAAGGP